MLRRQHMDETFSARTKRDEHSLMCSALHWLKLQQELNGRWLTAKKAILFFSLSFAFAM